MDKHNSKITYSLLEGRDTPSFRVDGDSGKISFVNSSHYRQHSQVSYTLEVLAVDSGKPELTGTCQVVIKVGHLCDNCNSLVPNQLLHFICTISVFYFLIHSVKE